MNLQKEIEYRQRLINLSLKAANENTSESLIELFNKQARRLEVEKEALEAELSSLKPNKNKKLTKKRGKKK